MRLCGAFKILKLVTDWLIRMARFVCLTRSKLNLITGTSVEAISEERASRSLYRIQLLSKIREEVEYFILIMLNNTTRFRAELLTVQVPVTLDT